MSRQAKILAFAGSVRKASFNTRLLAIGADAAGAAGAAVTLISLRDFPLPIYDGDIESESGMPDNARKLRSLMLEHDAFLIASPEYNGSVSGLLKNTLDWCSRPGDGREGLAPFQGKIVGLMSASLGPFGGLRGIIDLRGIMAKMGALVLPEDVAIAAAGSAFAEDDSLINAASIQAVKNLSARLVALSNTVHVPPEHSGPAR